MKNRATGTFTVKMQPLAADSGVDTGGFGRMSIDKQLSGDLAGSSKGQMVAGLGTVEGSGGYVAIERVTGTLHGRSGTFFLQHSATMTRGVGAMHIVVVPDSGTGELAGLSGAFSIIIDPSGGHSYTFDYSFEK